MKLIDELPSDKLQELLRSVSALVEELCGGDDEARVATACVGFGAGFFKRASQTPVGLIAPPAAQGELLDEDIVIYVMCREEWKLADFRRRLSTAAKDLVVSARVERGYQRPDGRELGGFIDGQRNAKLNRERIVFVDRNLDPDEPAASEGGTYMVTMRIVQDLAAWGLLSDAEQEAIIGRRKADGSRLDLSPGSGVEAEAEIAQSCPFNSHVAKAGPRGPSNDPVQIFRRGLPFADLTTAGEIEAGLLFVSFQASMEQFRTIAEEWMANADFPFPGIGADALFSGGLASVVNTGYFFVPAPSEFAGSQFFESPANADHCHGHVLVRKQLQDASGAPIRAERGGFVFQLFEIDGTTPIGEPFTTDSTGRALSPKVPLNATYVVRETVTRPGFTPAVDQQIVLDKKRAVVEVVNHASVPTPGYR